MIAEHWYVGCLLQNHLRSLKKFLGPTHMILIGVCLLLFFFFFLFECALGVALKLDPCLGTLGPKYSQCFPLKQPPHFESCLEVLPILLKRAGAHWCLQSDPMALEQRGRL